MAHIPGLFTTSYVFLERKRPLPRLLMVVLTWTLPLLLGLNLTTLSLNPAYPRWAYTWLPPDTYGWSQAERLALAQVTLDFLRQPAETAVSRLAALRLPGTNQPLYTAREQAHLADVKQVTDAARRWGGETAVLWSIGMLILFRRDRYAAYRVLRQGGWLTCGLLADLLLFVYLFWPVCFILFHQLLFPPGSWSFAASDTLIRLFPDRFWFGYACCLLASIFLSGLFLAGVGTWLCREVDRSVLTQWDMEEIP